MSYPESQYGKNSSIYPYYKPDNIFERDQAYYQQLQRNTRRGPNQSVSQASQRVPYQQVQTQYQNYPQNYAPQQLGYQQQQSQYGYQGQSTVQNFPIQSQTQFDISQSFGQNNEPQSPSFSRVDHSGQQNLNPSSLGYSSSLNPNSPQKLSYNLAQQGQSPQNLAYNIAQQQQSPQNLAYNLAQQQGAQFTHSAVNQQSFRTESQENRRLKQRLDDMINFRDQFDDGSEVKKKFHYNKDSNEGRTLMNQQAQVQSLLEQVNKNNQDIGRYRSAIVELQRSMNNIQSVDREIYRQLKNLSNRDQELLERATTALARGASRQEVAGILERIIS